MKQWLNQFISIIRITVSEATRQPLCILLAGGTGFIVMLLPFLITHQFGEAGRLVRDSSLSLQLVTGLLLALFLSSSAYQNEIRTGTMSVILCKPVSRSVFFLAKFCGIGIVLLIYSICMTSSILLASLASKTQYVINWSAQLPLMIAYLAAFIFAGVINYRLKRPFPAVALNAIAVCLPVAAIVGVSIGYDPGAISYLVAIVQAGILITAAVLVLAGLAVVLVPAVGVPAAVAGCGACFALGLMMDYLYGIYGDQSILVRFMFFIIPNWQRFWIVDSISGGQQLSLAYFAGALCYAFLYLVGIMCGGVLLFRRVEVGR